MKNFKKYFAPNWLKQIKEMYNAKTANKYDTRRVEEAYGRSREEKNRECKRAD